MDQDHFIRSLHELVDLWTVTTNAEEYLDFIDYTLTRVCEISPQTKFSFWTRAVQRLQLPRFLKLKLGPDGDDSQTPGNDGQLPESVAHILDSGSFSSSTLDKLRFEFHRAAPDGMLDLDGFKRVKDARRQRAPTGLPRLGAAGRRPLLELQPRPALGDIVSRDVVALVHRGAARGRAPEGRVGAE